MSAILPSSCRVCVTCAPQQRNQISFLNPLRLTASPFKEDGSDAHIPTQYIPFRILQLSQFGSTPSFATTALDGGPIRIYRDDVLRSQTEQSLGRGCHLDVLKRGESSIRIISGDSDLGLCVWSLDGSQVHRLGVADLSFSSDDLDVDGSYLSVLKTLTPCPSGDEVLVGWGSDGRLRCLNLEKAVCAGTFVGHTEPVFDVVASTKRHRFLTVSGDETARVWDSRRCHDQGNHGSVASMRLSSAGMVGCLAEELGDLLFVGVASGEVEVFDPRNLEERLRSFRLSDGYPVHVITRVSPDSFLSCSVVKPVCRWSSEGKVLATGTDRGSDACTIGSIYDHVLNFSTPEYEDVEHVGISMNAVVLKGANGSSLSVPRSLCGLSGEEESVTVDDVDFGSESHFLCSTLLGKDPSPSNIFALSRCLDALGLTHHLLVLCESLIRMSPQDLATVLSKCPPEFVLKVTDPDESVDCFSECVLRRLKSLDRTDEEVIRIFRSKGLLPFLKVGSVSLPSRGEIAEHMRFSGRATGSSFPTLFSELSVRLFEEARPFSNLVLLTDDGSEERVHLEVLLVKSRYFRGIIKEQLEQHKLTLSDFSSDELSAFLSWIYLRQFPPQSDLRALLRVLARCHAHEDVTAVRNAVAAVVSSIHALSPPVARMRVLEMGHEFIRRLPRHLLSLVVDALALHLEAEPEVVMAEMLYSEGVLEKASSPAAASDEPKGKKRKSKRKRRRSRTASSSNEPSRVGVRRSSKRRKVEEVDD